MTSIMISMTIGFIIFLNIVATIPHAKDNQEVMKDIGLHSIMLSHYFLPIDIIESVVKNHTYALDGWGATTTDIFNKY